MLYILNRFHSSIENTERGKLFSNVKDSWYPAYKPWADIWNENVFMPLLRNILGVFGIVLQNVNSDTTFACYTCFITKIQLLNT